MLNPMIREELVRAREADVARSLRHAHHKRDLPPRALASLTARVLDAVFKRNARERPVAPLRNLGSAADAAEKV